MVGAYVRAGDSLDYIRPVCKEVEQVALATSNSLGVVNANGMGNSGGGNNKGTKTCPDGYAITGVRGKHKTYPCETQWVCSKVRLSSQ